ncbi:class I SAM-dependent methyltransferase [Paraburkholderia flava]|uniref:class I SAM-dependent methyltransferase n=1 Tax=Paraburkholderia flava TaxID=2547393 RepID=UPI00106019EB|nr:methyltransferase domain-containing protein [Paraburkholderia flava]
MSNEAQVDPHYERGSLVERLKAALIAAGFDARAPRPEDLEPLDQFHSRGLDATIELAQALHLDKATQVLDIGSGLGGPSRYLASHYGSTVRGIDLSPSFVDAATFLAEKTGLADQVTYQCANALALPFEAEAFDVAWTQHVAMNIADRSALYGEAFRVLRRGGRFAIFDVVSVSDEPLHYPVPWASTPDTSFLVTADQMRAVLLEQGFSVESWTDSTAAGIEWFAEVQRKRAQQQAVPALGLHVVMGPGFREMAGNLARNLVEGRAGLVQAILRKA